jgi:hypothetical protein
MLPSSSRASGMFSSLRTACSLDLTGVTTRPRSSKSHNAFLHSEFADTVDSHAYNGKTNCYPHGTQANTV